MNLGIKWSGDGQTSFTVDTAEKTCQCRKGSLMKEQKNILDGSMGLNVGDIKHILTSTSMKTSDYTRYQQHHRGVKLRKPLEEDDRKAIFGKTQRTV